MTKKKLQITFAAIAVVGTVAIVGAMLLFDLGDSKNAQPTKDLGPVIATVDGRPIYLSLAEARVQGLTTVHGDVQDTLGKDWPDQVMESLVDDQIIEQEAERGGITMPPAEMESTLARLQGSATDQEFQAWLDKQSIDLSELQRRIELQYLGAHIYDEITGDVPVSNDDVRAFYDEHTSDYVDDTGAQLQFFEVKSSIRESLLKDEQDRVFADWLEAQRKQVEVVVLINDWWKDIA
jgi:hypothetical protein